MAFKIPEHVGIILDGNRRFAKRMGLKPWKGHDFGLKKLEDLFKWCIGIGIKELTLYCFSTENFKRARKEISYLFDLFWREFEKIQESKNIYKDKVRMNVIGRTFMFPKKMQKAMKEAMKKTEKNKELIVNMALAYGGRQEIVDAFKKIIKKGTLNPNKINEELISKNLYLQSEPDMVIRPGGEIRTSNFLTWQSIYSEWIFIPKLWPEFTKKDLIKCIEEFGKRERRFGR